MISDQATLIYDGQCGFCRRWIERVRRFDRFGRLEMLPYQSSELETRFPQVSRDACVERIHLVDASGQVYAGAAAAREALRRLPGGWFLALPFRLPGGIPIGDRIYSWIAHRWGPLGGKRPAEGSSK
jgi:predicted DCC family thiol-disulfide oxidoreductase YuxK